MTTRQMPWPAVLTDTEDVRHPPREYGILLFWFLNGELDPVEMRLQLREFRDKGMPGIILHECYGLEIPYLGEETSLERINFTLYPFIGNRDRPDRPDIHAIRRDHSASGTPLGHLRLGLAVMGRDGAPGGRWASVWHRLPPASAGWTAIRLGRAPSEDDRADRDELVRWGSQVVAGMEAFWSSKSRDVSEASEARFSFLRSTGEDVPGAPSSYRASSPRD